LTYSALSGKWRRSYALNSTKGHRERTGRLFQMHANHREDIDKIYAGDSAAVGPKNTFTGDTSGDPDKPALPESIVFPTPVIHRHRAENQGRQDASDRT
jgi:elongation factor G